MSKEELNEQIVKCLCREFQSVWIVYLKPFSMQVFTADVEASVPGSIDKGIKFKSYDEALGWYVDYCVVEQDKKRLKESASSENIRRKLAEKESYSVEYSRNYGEKVNYNQMFFARLDAENTEIDCFLLGFRDIDLMKRAERDHLTNVYTRPVFFRKAEEILNRCTDKQFDLMISDIVDFKEINEIYGSTVGDDILRWTGNFLAASISDELIVGRYGGDQFVMMCEHEYMKYITCEESRDAFINMMREAGLPKVLVKYGIYENIKHEKSIMSICDKAHIALNSIKHHYDKIAAFYDDKIRHEVEMNRRIESSMHQALEENQFKVYYQPKHDAATGKLVGAEALIRWIHPEYGFMSPGEFIDLFEKNGFIVEVDHYVWKRTCQNLKRWRESGIQTVPISVNASKLTFEQDDLLMKLKSYAEQHSVSPDMLHIEITETMMTYDVEDLIFKLNEIRRIGYKIELDDFGSGYSSINLLSTLPLDVIKLDRSFMKQFGNPSRTKVLAACINLAKDLGYKTVSEGVEHKEQCDMLNNLGVDAIQGFFFSKPLPEDEFEQYMKDHI